MMKLDIFMCVPGLPFDGDTIKKGSLGGSETAGVYMARELAKLGHRVTMFSGVEREGVFDKVRYVPIGSFNQASRVVPHDVCIIQRAPQLFAQTKASKLNVLWQHDLATKREEQNFRGSLWDIDMVLMLSEFHAAQYNEVYGLEKPWAYVTRNGIDTAAFDSIAGIARNRKRVFYAARPERGLDVLLSKVMPKLLAHDPDIVLAIAGYENKVDHLKPFYESCGRMIGGLGDSVVHLGALSKAQLYKEMAAASLYLYPTPSVINENFSEISCIAAMEAQACGLPVITSNRGALPETVKGGVLIDGDPTSDEYIDKFVAQTVHLLSDRAAWDEMSDRGKAHASTLDWGIVAREWSEEFERRIRANNADKERLAMHFLRSSDVDALDTIRAQGGFKTEQFGVDLGSYIDTQYGFRNSDEAFADHYTMHGADTDKALASQPMEGYAKLFSDNPEPRFAYVEQYLKSNNVKSVLDYGCGHGWMPIYMHNRLGVSVRGVDVDPAAIKWCNTFADKFAKSRDALKFSETLPDDGERFDCVVVSEVLEHVRNPYGLMERLEKFLTPGGRVLFTVPYGPAEFGTPHWSSFRNHIREWDLHDLHDIFGKRDGFAVGAVFSHFNEQTGDPVGSWVGVYTVKGDAEPLGRPNMARKLALQRPRESVSLNVMAGPGSGESIRWMLNSVKDVVDEVVIADTGMTKLDRIATEGFNIKFVEAPDPKVEGFETPRNIGLDNCTMDWVLWLDTDEKVTDPRNILKYLRHNCFNGYGMRQHHFAVDTTFSPDMPVRLFRRVPDDGQPLRWVGMIHEHPERGVNEGPGNVIVVSDVNIAHTGYLAESGRRGRFARNLPLLMKDAEKYPNRILQKHFIMRDKVQMASHHLQANGGVVTSEIAEHCKDVVNLYREHFLGKNIYMAIDSTHWYSEALRILNEGFEVAYSFDAGLSDVKPSTPRSLRYASREDFMADFTARVNVAIEPITHRYM